MSVINQMLRDLEQRRADADVLPPEPVLAFAKPRRSALPLSFLVVAMAAFTGYWLALRGASAPASEPIAPAVPVQSLAQPQPSLAPAPPTPSEPVAVMKPDSANAPAQPPAVPPQIRPQRTVGSASAAAGEPAVAERTAADLPAGERKATEARAGTKDRKDKGSSKIRRGGVLRSQDEDVEGMALRGARLAAEGDAAQARAMLERVLRERPAHRQARVLLGRLLIRQGEWDAAADLLDKGPQSAAGELASLRARVLLHRGQTEQAAAVLEAARGASSEDGAVLGTLGAIYQEQGRYADAIAVYRQALARQPAQPRWWLGLAVALDGGRHYGEALQAYREVLARPGLEGTVLAYARERADALERMAGER